jgi:phosphopantetheinyl transferase
VGVDAEPLRRLESIHEVAHMVFTAAERERIERNPELGVDLWVLKEAYMKAVGFGMSLPPSTFEMQRGEDHRWTVALLSPPAELALGPVEALAFHLFTLAEHRVAVCAPRTAQVQVTKRELLELLDR